MIQYRKGFLGLPTFLFWYGSVVPRCLIPATVSASVTFLVHLSYHGWLADDDESGEPSNFAYGAPMAQALNFIVGFMVVYRAQQGYARYVFFIICSIAFATRATGVLHWRASAWWKRRHRLSLVTRLASCRKTYTSCIDHVGSSLRQHTDAICLI